MTLSRKFAYVDILKLLIQKTWSVVVISLYNRSADVIHKHHDEAFSPLLNSKGITFLHSVIEIEVYTKFSWDMLFG